MLPAPSRPRLTGLPSSPRPVKPTRSARSSPYNTPSDLPPTSPVRSRAEHITPGSSSLHIRSRSQPPRLPRSSAHSRSASSSTRTDEDNTYINSTLGSRGQGQQRARQRLGVSASRGNSPAPLSRSPTPEVPYTRLKRRKATVDESSGDGYTIWNTVSTVASALTISVSKAWSANIAAFSGEETPPGQESRLTRAMKAYHIAKAQDPSDLPDWLFDERERRASSVRSQPDVLVDNQLGTSPPQNDIKPNMALDERQATTPTSHGSTPRRPQLRGTDRLKAMRDAKRGAGERDSSESRIGDRQPYNSTNEPQPPVRLPRIGLPSGPQRGGR